MMKSRIAATLVRRMGIYAFTRYCRNLGMSAEDTICALYGTPTVCKKPHLWRGN